ncbi:outer membrane protein [Legionella saoudiensis]|uniref:outer membrane protein n=1 Tax=Legionella saoudiensis TaxID=1750561 RepID=UPI0007307B57|nr:porin family protein [Legionella saoudiensis]
MNKNFVLIPLLGLISTNILAGTIGELRSPYSKVITISGGPSWTSNGKSQVISLEPDVIKAYRAKKENSILASGELFLGMQKSASALIDYQLGVAFALTSSAQLNGSIWDDADPEFDNFSYHYRIHHSRIAAKAKLLANTQFWAQPYLIGSVGVGFNRANDFMMEPKTIEQLPFPGFTSHTKTSFSYTAGAGLQKGINESLSVGMGYEFADWGKSRLSRSEAQSIGTGLRLNHLYTHQLQFSISYTI